MGRRLGLGGEKKGKGGLAFRWVKGAGMEKWEKEALLGGEWGPEQPHMEEGFDLCCVMSVKPHGCVCARYTLKSWSVHRRSSWVVWIIFYW